MKLFSLFSGVALAAAISSTGFATHGVEIVSQPEFSPDCPAASRLKLVNEQGVAKIEIAIPGVNAVATPVKDYDAKNCTATVALKAPEGYRLVPGTLRYEGSVALTKPDQFANILAEYYLTGTPALQGYASFEGPTSAPYAVETYGHTDEGTSCGGIAEFNFMADVAAYSAGTGLASMRVVRGSASADLPLDLPVFQCGVKVIRCGH